MKRSKTSSGTSNHGLSTQDLAVLLERHDLRKKSLYVQVEVDSKAVAETSKLANELYEYCDSKPNAKGKGRTTGRNTKTVVDEEEKELLRKIQLRIWACDTVLKEIHNTLGYKFVFKGWQNTEHGLVYRYKCAQEDKENPCCSGSMRILFPSPSLSESTPAPEVPSSSMRGGSSVPSSVYKKRVGRPRKETSATPSRSLTPAGTAISSSSTFPSIAKIRITHLGKHKNGYAKGEKNVNTEASVSASKKRTRDTVLENALEAKRLEYLDEAKLLLRALQREFDEVKEADGEALHSFVQRVKRAREESDGEMD